MLRDTKFIYLTRLQSILCSTVNSSGDIVNSDLSFPIVSSGDVIFDPFGRFAYVFGYDPTSTVSSYSLNKDTGRFTLINSVTMSDVPDYSAVTPDGKYLYCSYFTTNNIGAFAVDQTTGELSALPETPSGTFPEGLLVTPSGKFLILSNYTDNNLQSYAIDSLTGALSLISSVNNPGAGLWRLDIHPNGKWIYGASWSSNEVTTFELNPSTGALSVVGQSGTMLGWTNPEDIKVSKDGRYVYTPNLVGNVARLIIDSRTGLATVADLTDYSFPGALLVNAVMSSSNQLYCYVTDGINLSVIDKFIPDATTGILSAPVVELSVSGLDYDLSTFEDLTPWAVGDKIRVKTDYVNQLTTPQVTEILGRLSNASLSVVATGSIVDAEATHYYLQVVPPSNHVLYHGGQGVSVFFTNTTDRVNSFERDKAYLDDNVALLTSNTSGTPIAKGMVVRQTGFDSTKRLPAIEAANAVDLSTSTVIMGIAEQDIPIDGTGLVLIEGAFDGLNTYQSVAGDTIYVFHAMGGVYPSPGVITATIGTVLDTDVIKIATEATGSTFQLSTGFSTVCYVDPNGNDSTAHRGLISNPFRTITAAVAAAEFGDTIEIAPGTYVENVLINTADASALSFNGSSQGNTVIQGNFTYNPTNKDALTNYYLFVNNLTITGTFTTDDSGLSGGIFTNCNTELNSVAVPTVNATGRTGITQFSFKNASSIPGIALTNITANYLFSSISASYVDSITVTGSGFCQIIGCVISSELTISDLMDCRMDASRALNINVTSDTAQIHAHNCAINGVLNIVDNNLFYANISNTCMGGEPMPIVDYNNPSVPPTNTRVSRHRTMFSFGPTAAGANAVTFVPLNIANLSTNSYKVFLSQTAGPTGDMPLITGRSFTGFTLNDAVGGRTFDVLIMQFNEAP